MSKSLRLSEKWFRRGLWLVALVFASFLIGLGGTVVGDLPKVEAPLQLDDFLDQAAAQQLRAQREADAGGLAGDRVTLVDQAGNHLRTHAFQFFGGRRGGFQLLQQLPQTGFGLRQGLSSSCQATLLRVQ